MHADGSPALYPFTVLRLVDSSIETSATDAGGGDIVIRGPGSIRLSGSGIDASDTASDGGNVDILAQKDIVVADTSRILARAAIPGGDGGVIEIATNAFVISPDSEVIAENEVIIRSPETNIEAEVTDLPVDFQDSGQLFTPQCAVRSGAQLSGSFTVDARPAIPVSPVEVVDLGPPADAGLAPAEAAFEAGRFADVLTFVDTLPEGQEVLSLRAAALAAQGAQDQADAALARALSAAPERGPSIAALRQAELLALRGDRVGAQAVLTRAREGLQPDSRLAVPIWLLSARVAQTASELSAYAGQALDAMGDGATAADVRQRLYLAATLLDGYFRDGDRALLEQAHAQYRGARDRARRLGDDRLLAFAYAGLADVYQADGQLDDALGLIRAAISTGSTAAGDSLFRWYHQEAGLLAAVGDADTALAAYGNALSELEAVRPMSRARYGPRELGFREFYTDYVDALLGGATGSAEQSRLTEARLVVERFKQSELENYFRDECVAALNSRAENLDEVDSKTAVVYPILLPDRVELLVSHDGRIHRYTVSVPIDQVSALAVRLRRGLENRTSNEYLPDAERMYRLLVAPYVEDVTDAGVNTLVFVPDSVLLGIPMAALHDGHSFVLERFAVAVTPGLTLIAPAPLKTRDRAVLLAGVSEPQADFAALPNVQVELADIQKLIGGEVLLDDAFSAEEFTDRFVAEQPAIVHVASHAVFGDSADTSYLLAHDQPVSIEALHNMVAESKFREPLELLTLSACETAAGDEQAALGLSGTAIRAGARSALGTLWTVSDEASRALIVEFYRQVASGRVTKAQALQHAQLKLAEGGRFRHPYYWSPYLLISNWL
jgi:CHAT domain-containing protein